MRPNADGPSLIVNFSDGSIVSLPLLSTPDGLHVQVGSEPDGQGLTMARQWVSDVTVPAAPARVFVQRLGAGPAEG